MRLIELERRAYNLRIELTRLLENELLRELVGQAARGADDAHLLETLDAAPPLPSPMW